MKWRRHPNVDTTGSAQDHSVALAVGQALTIGGEALVHYDYAGRAPGDDLGIDVSHLMPPAWIATCTEAGCEYFTGSCFDRLTDTLSAVVGHRLTGHEATMYAMWDDRKDGERNG